MYGFKWLWLSRKGRFSGIPRGNNGLQFQFSMVWNAGTVYDTLLKTCSYETYKKNREDMRRKGKDLAREIPKGLIEHWMFLPADLS